MSFGFAVGDVVQVGALAWRLYRDCYKVARDAPQEFQLLVAEMSTMSNSLGMLQEEIKDPDSSILQAGEERVQLVNTMVSSICVTLQGLEKYAAKYEISGTPKSATRLQLRQKVKNFKWTLHRKSIEELRSKMHQHNGLLTLLLTSAGNSSLQRIQSSTNALEEDVAVIRNYVSEQQGGRDILAPSLSFVDDEYLRYVIARFSQRLHHHLAMYSFLMTLKAVARRIAIPRMVSKIVHALMDNTRSSISATLLKHAEVSQPWTTIGVTQWIDTGRWWLQGCELELYAISDDGIQIAASTYASLLKASWILVDIIACHPQVSFISAKTRAEIKALGVEIKRDFEKIQSRGLKMPDLTTLHDDDLRIWEDQVRAPTIRRQSTALSDERITDRFWTVEGDEVALFVQRAVCKIGARDSPVVCDVLFLVRRDAKGARLLANAQAQIAALEIHFSSRVNVRFDLDSVFVNGEEIILKNPQNVHLLASLVETANYFYFERNQSYNDVEAFKAYLDIVIIKNKFEDLPKALVPSLFPGHHAQDQALAHKVVSIAALIAQESADQILNQKLHDGRERLRSQICLFSWAVQIGHDKLVALLLEEKAAWITDQENDFSPLMMAGYCNHEAVTKVLLDHITKSNTLKESLAAKQKYGWSALHYACSHSDEKIVRLFLRSKADIHAPGSDKWTPLHCAAHHDKAPIVQLLLDKGAKGEAKDKRGLTPLLMACRDTSEAAIQILLAEDVNVKAEDDTGSTALHWALETALTHRLTSVSKPVFDDLFFSYWSEEAIYKRNRPFKRDIVTYQMNSDWIHLFLDTPHARFEFPDACPKHVTNIYDRVLEFHKPPGAKKFFQFKITLHVIHKGNSLDFATSHGTLSAEGRAAMTKLQVENGGEFISKPTNDGRNFRRHLNVKTDPNALIIDQDSSPFVRETKE